MAHNNASVLLKADRGPKFRAGKIAAGLQAAPQFGGYKKECSKAWLIAIGILAAAFLPGCATNPPSTVSDTSRASGAPPLSSYRGKAPYNRPYEIRGKRYYPMATARGYRESGVASWYGWESGNRTAMGTRFNPQALTAAHKTLPLPTRVKVTNVHNGRSVVVLVNDRGPFVKNRIIDLSQRAARAIGIRGLGHVLVESLEGRDKAKLRREPFGSGPYVSDTRGD